MARLHWASSRTVGGVSEIAVLAPIRKGSTRGERRTHEESLREIIANLARRHEAGMPTELDPVSSIHFGRMLIIRPEQYLRKSVFQVDQANRRSSGPDPFDEYQEVPAGRERAEEPGAPSDLSTLRSWLLVLVEFDGDLRVYLRDIARSVRAFDDIFIHCEDYPGTRSFEAFWLWIKRYQISVDLLYTRYPDTSVVRLKELVAFKRGFDAFVAQVRSPTGKRLRSLDDAFDAFLRENMQRVGGFPSLSGVYPAGGD